MRRLIACTIASILWLLPAAGLAQVTAFENVTVITMDGGQVLADQTVVVHGRRIAQVGPSAGVTAPESAVLVDGSGKYLIPGLAEMHGHLPHSSRDDASIDREMLLYVANGVTTVRGMLGNPLHLRLRAEIAAGERLGPRLFAAGPSLNGSSVQSTQQAWDAVTEQKAAGYDLLKIHPGLTREHFDEIAKMARRERIPFGGHIPTDVGLEHALKMGIVSIEHIDGYIEAMLDPKSTLEASQTQFFGVNMVHDIDPTKLDGLVAETVRAGAWVVPTQCLMQNVLGTDPDESARDPSMQFVSPAQVATWKSQAQGAQQQLGTMTGLLQQFLDLRLSIIDELHEAGVGVLLGADSPQVFNVPGFATLQELEHMVEAGLTPYEALETGTINPARFFGLEDSFGTVAEGKRADLILLEANPLENISNVRKRAGVMVAGHWMTAAELSAELQKVKNAVRPPAED